MSVPAFNPAATPAGSPGPAGAAPPGLAGAAAGASASDAFSALLGVMFGDQHGLAAQLFAGAKGGAKTTNPGGADGKGAETAADPSALAQAQGLAAGFLAAPVALVDQAQTTTQTPDGATVDPDAGKTPPGQAVAQAATAVPGQAEPEATDADPTQPAPTQTPPADAKAATPPGLAVAAAVQSANTGDATDASAQAQSQASGQTGQPSPGAAVAAAAAAAQTNPKATPTAEKAPAGEDKSAKAVGPVEPAGPQTAVVQAATDAKPQGDAGAGADKDPHAAAPLPEAPKEAAADRRDAPPVQPPAPAVTQAGPAANAATPVRGAPETVAHLAAQIAKHLEGRSSHFDIQLSPAGLGHVGVRVEISAHGQLTAAMSFDNAHAAAEVRSRAAELTRALEQAGFDVSGGLSFDVAGDQGRAGYGAPQQDNDSGGAWRGRAFQAALGVAGDTAEAAVAGALNLQRRSRSGVDIRI